MKVSVYRAPMQLEYTDMPLPSLQEGDLLLRVHACGLCGTDIRKIRFGLCKPGSILGHEVAGEVAQVQGSASPFKVGDRVVVAHHLPCYSCHYCRHQSYSMCRSFKASNLDPGGFSEFVRVPKIHLARTSFLIPGHLSYDQSIHMEPLACVLRNIRRAKLLPGDTVLIIGLGSVGIMTAQVVRNWGGQVAATDLRPDRRQKAKDLGFESIWDPSDPHWPECCKEITRGRGADLVVLTAGTPEVYGQSVSYVRDGGQISLFGTLDPLARVTYALEEIYHREITIYSSYSASPSDLEQALGYLKEGTVQVDALNPRTYPLSGLPLAIEDVIHQRIFKAIVHP